MSFLKLFIFLVNILGVLLSEDILLTTTTTSILNNSTSDVSYYRCENHFNCSRKFLSLETYCCEKSGECCNWFQFMYSFNNKTGSTLVPYKSPTILTVFTMLILFVCLLFVSYCISILFCYCFKCGLFKRPRVVVISAVPIDNVSSTSSDTTSMLSSPKPHQSNSSYRQRSKVGAKRNVRSPTARAIITNDCDNDSPFLIPSSNRSSTSSSNRRKNTNRHHSTRSECNNSYRNRSSNIQRRTSLQQEHNSQLANRLNTFETVNSSIRSSRSSLSLDLHETRAANGANTRSEVEPSAPSYYHDEKPPAYDEIVGRNY